MPQQIDPLTQALIQKALANRPAWTQQQPTLPAHPSINDESGREWFLRKAQGVTDPAELDRLYQISRGPGQPR